MPGLLMIARRGRFFASRTAGARVLGLTAMGMNTDARTAQALQPIDDAFETACDLASDRAIISVHVVVDRRLTYDDLLRYRHRAESRNLSFAVTKTNRALGFRLFRRRVRQSRWT